MKKIHIRQNLGGFGRMGGMFWVFKNRGGILNRILSWLIFNLFRLQGFKVLLFSNFLGVSL
jgi:hypothetical protein